MMDTGVHKITNHAPSDGMATACEPPCIESLNAFVACRSGQHHRADHDEVAPPRSVGFTICDSCGLLEEFVDASLFPRLDQSLLENGFTPRTTAVEVHV